MLCRILIMLSMCAILAYMCFTTAQLLLVLISTDVFQFSSPCLLEASETFRWLSLCCPCSEDPALLHSEVGNSLFFVFGLYCEAREYCI